MEQYDQQPSTLFDIGKENKNLKVSSFDIQISFTILENLIKLSK